MLNKVMVLSPTTRAGLVRGFRTCSGRYQAVGKPLEQRSRKEQQENVPVEPDTATKSEDIEGNEGKPLESAVEKVRAGLESARKKAFQELRGDVRIKSLKEISEENDKLMVSRYIRPLRKWSYEIKADSLNHLKRSGLESEQISSVMDGYTAGIMSQALGKPKVTVTASDLFEPLDAGDAVELSSSLNQSVLAVIVSVPFSDNDPRYTVMTRLGELFWLEKSAFKFRIPRVIPKPWLKDIVKKTTDPSADYGSIKTSPKGFARYMVNPLARQIISQPLIDITKAAWDNIQQTSRKLEIIHRLLETNGPRQVSLLTLVNATAAISLKEFENQINEQGVILAYKNLAQSLQLSCGVDFGSGLLKPLLGKEYGSVSISNEYDIALLYSVVLTLRKQTALWSTQNQSRSTFVPLSVTVLPMKYNLRITEVLDALRSPAGERMIHQFKQYIESGNYTPPGKEVKDLMFLLKEYAVGNISDPISETVICQVMKRLFSTRVTKTLVWDTLVKVGYIDSTLVNPQHFTNSLAFPGRDVSPKAELEEEYFQLCEVNERNGADRAHKRIDMSHLRVFCIDSETAHEIDDGVSIEHIGKEKTRLHIHIADPTSYLEDDSTLMKVAFERAFTTYQPETISAMFPKRMSDMAGLGVDGKVTRAMTFSIDVERDSGVVDFSSAQVNATLVSKFPKYTYDDVDRTLSEAFNVENQEHNDLREMSNLSVLLRANRIQEGAVVYPDTLSVQVRVHPQGNVTDGEKLDGATDDEAVSFEGQKSTQSVILVTEFMILANKIAATVLKNNGLPGVFKTMPALPLAGSASEVVKNLNERSKEGCMNLSDLVKSFKFVTPAVYSHCAGPHVMLGVERYAPSTSPLRRFGDVVNHMQFHSLLNGEKMVFNHEQVLSMVLHIEARNDILKKASRGSLTYYSMKALNDRISEDGTVDAQFIVVSPSIGNTANGLLLEYGVFGKMTLVEGRHPPSIGDIIERFRVQELDPVGLNLVLEEID